MKGNIDLHLVLMAVVLCCCLQPGCGQHSTDIYSGCYFDNLQRALTDLITCADDGGACHGSCGETNRYCQSMDRMTLNLCRDLCRRRNLRYYALQAGNQCFCGGGLSDPFQHGMVNESQLNCSYPCSGNSSQTCGADYRMQVYEFAAHLPGSACFYPGYVQNSFAQHVENVPVGTTVSYICQPQHKITGDARITCQANGGWLPNTLPICNYTGIIEDPTTQNPTTARATTAAKPLSSITDFLHYIIGGAALLLLILVVCLIGIFVCGRRKRSGNAGQNISLKPEPAPVTFLNTGFQPGDDTDAKVDMPDILSATRNSSSPPPGNLYDHRMSTFAEEPLYLNSEAAGVHPDGGPYDDPPSPIYLNADEALPPSTPPTDSPDGSTRYIKRDSTTTTDRGSSSQDPSEANTSSNRRAKKNGKGTKDLVGWSRPSSLYQRTEMEDEDSDSNEDNTVVEPNALSAAIYAQIDKSQKSGSRETLNSEVSGNSFFADPAKSSATRL